MQNQISIWDWNLVKLVCYSAILLIITNFTLSGFSEDSVRRVIAGTARVDVFFFCLAFGSTALHQILKNSFSFWLMMNRKYWGISFAILHFIHLTFLVVLQNAFHPVFTLADSFALFSGGTAYLFITLMFLTSFDFFANRLSRNNWKWLHFIGGHWIWVIFMSSYWKKVFRVGIEFLPLAMLLVVVMGIRLWVRLGRTKTVN